LSKLAVDPLARANHTGTQLASTVSNFDTQVRSNRLDQMATPTTPVSAGSQIITNLGTPAVATDAATKGYVDGAVGAFAQSIGDGVAVSYTVTHSLGTKDVSVDVYDVATGATVYPDVTRGTVNAVTVAFAVAPTANQYRALVRR
jgi:hypothetical protein